MAAMMVLFLAMGVFFTVGGLLEKTADSKAWDKLLRVLNFD